MHYPLVGIKIPNFTECELPFQIVQLASFAIQKNDTYMPYILLFYNYFANHQHISISQITDFHFVSFCFANYSKPVKGLIIYCELSYHWESSLLIMMKTIIISSQSAEDDDSFGKKIIFPLTDYSFLHLFLVQDTKVRVFVAFF